MLHTKKKKKNENCSVRIRMNTEYIENYFKLTILFSIKY
jgi:hypothetical protein